MVINDWQSVRQQIDLIAQKESEKLREQLEKSLAQPKTLLDSALKKYQENCKENQWFRENYTQDERVSSLASQLLWPVIEPIEEEFRTQILEFINTPELQAFLETLNNRNSGNDIRIKSAIDRIRIHELGHAKRKYFQPMREEFADKLAPNVKELLLKADRSAKETFSNPNRFPNFGLKMFTFFWG